MSPQAYMRRRSYRSDSTPLMGARSKVGTNSAKPSKPRSSGSPVMSNTCLPSIVIWPTVMAAVRKMMTGRAHSRGPIRVASTADDPELASVESSLGISQR